MKYIVTRDTIEWDNLIEDTVDETFNSRKTIIEDQDPFLAREASFIKAKELIDFFEDEEQQTHLPAIKWSEYWTIKEPEKWLFYQIRIDFEFDGKTYCVFDTGDGVSDETEPFLALQREFEILKNNGFEFKEEPEFVNYFDREEKINKKCGILPNGTNWEGVKIGFDPIEFDEIFKALDDKPEKKAIKEAAKKSKKDPIYKSTYLQSFILNNDKIQISIKTSSETLPNYIEKAIDEFVQKLKKL